MGMDIAWGMDSILIDIIIRAVFLTIRFRNTTIKDVEINNS